MRPAWTRVTSCQRERNREKEEEGQEREREGRRKEGRMEGGDQLLLEKDKRVMEQPLNKQTVRNPLPSPWKPGSGFIVQGN